MSAAQAERRSASPNVREVRTDLLLLFQVEKYSVTYARALWARPGSAAVIEFCLRPPFLAFFVTRNDLVAMGEPGQTDVHLDIAPIQIHAEHLPHQVKVTTVQHLPVRQPGILEPITPAPAPVIGIKAVVAACFGIYGEQGSVKFYRIIFAPGARIDPAPGCVAPGDGKGVLIAGDNKVAALPKIRLPDLMGLPGGFDIQKIAIY